MKRKSTPKGIIINKITDTIDIGKCLVDGKNDITIELTTTLNKRAKVESA